MAVTNFTRWDVWEQGTQILAPGKVLPKAAAQPFKFGGRFTCNQRWGVNESVLPGTPMPA